MDVNAVDENSGAVLSVIAVDDHDLIRMALQSIIEARRGLYRWSGGAATAAGARELLLEQRPDLAIVDIDIAGDDGLQLIEDVRPLLPHTRFMVLSAHSGTAHVSRALKAGVYAYVLKNHVLVEMHSALKALRNGTPYLSPELERLPTLPELTPRQTEVLIGVARGQSAKVLARQLGISSKTVEFHKAELKKRLGVHDTAGLALYAIQQGLIK